MRTIPAAIGKYVVEREIGRGASSTVYLGYDPFHRRQVAIKQIHAHLLTDPDQLARYRRHLHKEAAVSGKLNHPHIVRLLDADVDADPPYLVLEYVEGQSLSSFTSVERALSVPQVLDLAFKCCGALEHANENGLVHRDIKPANLILQSNGVVKVTDFGTALSLSADTTQVMGLVGSPSYMSPEQVREQDCTYQSDMFSLAVVVYELLTGRKPFDGETDFATMYKITTVQPSPPSLLRADLPAAVDAVVMQALEKKPDARYSRWSDFADALLSVSRSLPARRAAEREGERFAELRALSFFSEFHDPALWETLRLARLNTFARGSVLMREGDPGDSFFVILQGQVTVSRNAWKLATLPSGVTLGEMTYLEPGNPARSATAIAGSDVVALEIRNEALRHGSEELQTCFDKAFIKLLVNRLIDTTAQVGSWDILGEGEGGARLPVP
jgi:serine/threonine protein kinase